MAGKGKPKTGGRKKGAPNKKTVELWIAEYGVSMPKVPTPWDNWTFWQNTDSGMDYDLFNGTLEDLKAMCANNGGGQLN